MQTRVGGGTQREDGKGAWFKVKGAGFKVKRRERERCDWRILACDFLFWFVHGLELLQQAGGREDVGRSWRHTHTHTHGALDLHVGKQTGEKYVFSSCYEWLLEMRPRPHNVEC